VAFAARSALVDTADADLSIPVEIELMKKLATAMSLVLALAGAQAVLADQHKSDEDAPKGEISQATEVQATVTAIDMKTRMVTLKGPDGKETTFYVDERARNLGKVKVGDVVNIAYVEALAWKVRKSKKEAPSASIESGEARAKPGEQPAGAVAQRISITAVIEAIDLANGTVTLKGPEGNTRTIKARNPANLKKVKVGDLVDITYTELVAIKVEPAKK
jgi:Cu/Ag efflux protein CusF